MVKHCKREKVANISYREDWEILHITRVGLETLTVQQKHEEDMKTTVALPTKNYNPVIK